MHQNTYADGNLLEWIGGIGVGSVCLLLAFLSRGGFGIGDGWTFLVTGIYLGFGDTVRLLMLALLFAFFFALICLLKKECGRKQELPLIPFLLGAYLCLLAGG